jgi:rhodanese-related sulfurtransferase
MKYGPRFAKLVEDAKANVTEVSIADVKGMLDRGEPFALVDVREESEWAAGALPNAIYLGRGVLERDIEARIPDPSTPIVLYCRGGGRSALAALSLAAMGYTKLSSMSGGVRAWEEAGYGLRPTRDT